MVDFLLSCLTARGTGGVALKPGEPFAVRTTLLVGPGTRGPAAALAARLRKLKAGEILGWETGGSAAYFGGEKRFRLPASGLEYVVSARYYSAPGQIPPVPILPDLQFTDSLLRPYKGNIRSFVLDRISKRKLAAP